jgi:hypothetical protein
VISVICWKWGSLFGPEYPNRTRSMLARHLHLPHRLFCVTDDAHGIDPDIGIIAMPKQLADTPRCRRRMQQYSADFDWLFGERLLSIDLDVVLVDDITPIVDRPETIVCWRVGYAGVYSGSFVLWNAGALDGTWQAYRSDPDGYPERAQPRGIGSDQAMLNLWLRETRARDTIIVNKPPAVGVSSATGQPASTPLFGEWTEADGFVSYFGDGYEKLEHHGVGPTRQALPPGARIVVLGSADKAAMDEGRYDWVRRHWR